jgi:hypothetical protein
MIAHDGSRAIAGSTEPLNRGAVSPQDPCPGVHNQPALSAEVPRPQLNCVGGGSIKRAQTGIRFDRRITVEPVNLVPTPTKVRIESSRAEAVELLDLDTAYYSEDRGAI